MTTPPPDHEAASHRSTLHLLEHGRNCLCGRCNSVRCYLDAISRAEKAERENAELRTANDELASRLRVSLKLFGDAT